MTEIKTILSQLEGSQAMLGLSNVMIKLVRQSHIMVYQWEPSQNRKDLHKSILDLFVPLWQTGILEAQYLAIQIVKTN